jgi:hypothetical protein
MRLAPVIRLMVLILLLFCTACDVGYQEESVLTYRLAKLPQSGKLELSELPEEYHGASDYNLVALTDHKLAASFTYRDRKAFVMDLSTRTFERFPLNITYNDDRDFGVFRGSGPFSLYKSWPNALRGYELVDSIRVQRFYPGQITPWKTDTVFVADRYASNRLKTVRSVTTISGATQLYAVKEQTFAITGNYPVDFNTVLTPFFERYVVVEWPLNQAMRQIATIDAKGMIETHRPTVVHRFPNGSFALIAPDGSHVCHDPVTKEEKPVATAGTYIHLGVYTGKYCFYPTGFKDTGTAEFVLFNAETGAQSTLNVKVSASMVRFAGAVAAGENRVAVLFASESSPFKLEMRLIDLLSLKVASFSFPVKEYMHFKSNLLWMNNNLWVVLQ